MAGNRKLKTQISDRMIAMAGYNLPSSFSGREAGASLVAGSAQQKLGRGTSATFLLSTILALGIASASVPAGAYDIAGGSVITIDPGNPQSWTGALRIGVVGSGTLRILDGGVVTSTSSMVGGHGPIGSGRGGCRGYRGRLEMDQWCYYHWWHRRHRLSR